MCAKQQLQFRLLSFFTIFLFISPTADAQSCTTWLNVPGQPSFVRVGDLDIAGNKITVEAIFNRTSPWNGADVFQGDLVSKHEDFRDCNYLLRPGSAEITTTNGYFKTPNICPIKLNKTYHVAMVYDGAVLKFYRNGYLMSQVAATGNLFQNDWLTQIGLYFNQVTTENFIGYINEVRIWNTVRTQAEINAYMSLSLPSPSTQVGLQAYYVFDNLLNKQGNTAWNGTLHGTASINKTNPNCNFVQDSCDVLPCVKPTITIRSDTAICQGSSLVLTSSSSNATTFSWQPVTGLDNPLSPNPVASPLSTTKYVVTSLNSGCEAKDSILLTVNAAPLISISEDTTICKGGNVKLQATGGVDYKWSPATAISGTTLPDPVANPINTTTYQVDAKGANGCYKQSSVTVYVRPKPDFKLESVRESICLGEALTLNASGGDTYQWLSQSGAILSNSNKVEVTPVVNTMYKVLISESKCGIQDSLFAPVTVNTLPVPSIKKSNDINCSLGEAQLIATGGARYEWFPTVGLSNPAIANPIAAPDKTTTYYVTVRSPNGCIAKDSLTIEVKADGGGELYIPSAFSPNGDNINDCFSIKQRLGIKEFSLEIYNRWGEKIFFSDTLPFCWNGSYKGRVQPEGVFIYKLKAKTLCGEVFKKGTIVLVR